MPVPDLLIDGLVVRAPSGRVLLDVPRLDLPAGHSLALFGASGAGKSTLLNAMAGLIRPAQGRVLWGKTDIAALPEEARARFRREALGMIFQDSHLFEELSPFGNAALAAAFTPRAGREAIRARACDWLGQLGIADGRRRVDSHSGGERQRIAVARALASGPAVILADEPTAALDRANADALGDALLALVQDRGCTLIVVTHDARLAGRMSRRIRLADGRIAEDRHV